MPLTEFENDGERDTGGNNNEDTDSCALELGLLTTLTLCGSDNVRI